MPKPKVGRAWDFCSMVLSPSRPSSALSRSGRPSDLLRSSAAASSASGQPPPSSASPAKGQPPLSAASSAKGHLLSDAAAIGARAKRSRLGQESYKLSPTAAAQAPADEAKSISKSASVSGGGLESLTIDTAIGAAPAASAKPVPVKTRRALSRTSGPTGTNLDWSQCVRCSCRGTAFEIIPAVPDPPAIGLPQSSQPWLRCTHCWLVMSLPRSRSKPLAPQACMVRGKREGVGPRVSLWWDGNLGGRKDKQTGAWGV